MTRHSFTTILLALLAAIAPSVWAKAPRTAPASDDARKARYIFLESANFDEPSELTDYYMLRRRALALDPANPYYGGAVAEIDIQLARDSSAFNEAYRRLRARFLSSPLEAHYADVYTSIASQLNRYDDALEAWQMLDSLQPSRTDPAVNMAALYLAKGNAAGDTASMLRAVDIYNHLQESQSASVQLSEKKIQALAALGDTTAITDELARLNVAAPANVQALLFSAGIYSVLGRPDSASANLDRAAALAPDNGLVRRMRARTYAMQSDTVNFRREVALALQSPSLEYGEKFNLFLDHLRTFAADTTAADDILRLFGVFQEANPGEATLHNLYGEYLGAVERYAEAAEQYSYGVALDPTDQDSWDSLIRMNALAHADSTAAAYGRQALQRFPSDIYAGLVAASGLTVADDNRQALAVLDSIRILPTHNPKAVAQIYAFKADIMARLEMVDSAVVNYERAVALDAENYMALNNAAYYMAEHGGDLPRAEVYASIACAAEPENATYLDTYAWIMFRKRDFARAQELIDRALAAIAALKNESSQTDVSGTYDASEEESPHGMESYEIYSHAGDIYYMNGRPDRAVELWRKALELEPDNELLRRKVEAKAYYYE